jgi:hypothetical protein
MPLMFNRPEREKKKEGHPEGESTQNDGCRKVPIRKRTCEHWGNKGSNGTRSEGPRS